MIHCFQVKKKRFKYYLGPTVTLKKHISNNETVYRTLPFYSKPKNSNK